MLDQGEASIDALSVPQVVPETQPVLPCLLRRLLQQGRIEEAQILAAQHAAAPHFARSLEWLLFTSLEIDADLSPSPAKLRSNGQTPPPPAAGQLLTAAADLLRRFPQVTMSPFSIFSTIFSLHKFTSSKSSIPSDSEQRVCDLRCHEPCKLSSVCVHDEKHIRGSTGQEPEAWQSSIGSGP